MPLNIRDRRERFHIDWSLNITNIIAILALLFTLANYGRQVITYLKSIDSRTNIMWAHFDKSQLTREDLIKLGLN